MYPDRLLRCAVRFAAAISLAAAVLVIGLSAGGWAATPKAGKPASAKTEATPEKIQQLMTLLADPKVRDWLEQESKAEAAQERKSGSDETSVSHYIDKRVGATREHIVALAAAIPDLPDQFAQAEARISADLGDRGRIKVLLHL